MPTQTYRPLATVTLGSSAASVTFSSIPATYRDLIVAATAQDPVSGTTFSNIGLQFNNDTGSNYNWTDMYGDGTSAVAQVQSNSATILAGYMSSQNNVFSVHNFQFMDYSATDKHKTVLVRSSLGTRSPNTTQLAQATTGRWANTAAITSIRIIGGTAFKAGSTFNLYGIAS
jgi:hypothetical protein